MLMMMMMMIMTWVRGRKRLLPHDTRIQTMDFSLRRLLRQSDDNSNDHTLLCES